MFSNRFLPSKHHSSKAAFLFAAVFAPNVQSQESREPHQLSASCCSETGLLVCTTCRDSAGLAPILTAGNAEWRIQLERQKPVKLAAFTSNSLNDDDRQDDKRKHEKKKASGKKNGDKKSELLDQHQDQPLPPVHPEVLELLRNMNKTLKAIEALARNDAESDRSRPSQPFQMMNKMPQIPMPHMFNPMVPGPHMNGPHMNGPQMNGPQMNGPHNSNLPKERPLGQGPPFKNE